MVTSSANPWWNPEGLARRKPFLDVRRAATKAVRAYFQAEGFLEVETPAIQVSPGVERHIQAFATTLSEPQAGSQPRYLHTSPEFAMKKLMAGGHGIGMSKIVQLCRVWRDRERSPLHHPEFTMLEWYRADADYGALMTDCEALLRNVAMAAERTLQQGDLLRWRGRRCDPSKDAERVTVQEAFIRYAGIDLLATTDGSLAPPVQKLRDAARGRGLYVSDTDTWEDVFFRVMLERVEPQIGMGAPTILCEYPANLAALARRKPGNAAVAERFELYACGVELANAYSELTDPAEQRARFEHDRALHVKLYGHAPPLDEDFLRAMESLPPCAGAALGFDRLVMLAAGATDITDVLWSPIV